MLVQGSPLPGEGEKSGIIKTGGDGNMFGMGGGRQEQGDEEKIEKYACVWGGTLEVTGPSALDGTNNSLCCPFCV